MAGKYLDHKYQIGTPKFYVDTCKPNPTREDLLSGHSVFLQFFSPAPTNNNGQNTGGRRIDGRDIVARDSQARDIRPKALLNFCFPIIEAETKKHTLDLKDMKKFLLNVGPNNPAKADDLIGGLLATLKAVCDSSFLLKSVNLYICIHG